ncbi:MAG: hypothetical protein ACXW1D_00415 [Halobacteriota archaeon]
MDEQEFFNVKNELRRMWMSILISWQDVSIMEAILLYECAKQK